VHGGAVVGAGEPVGEVDGVVADAYGWRRFGAGGAAGDGADAGEEFVDAEGFGDVVDPAG